MIDIFLFGCGEHARMVIDNIEDQEKYNIVGLISNSLLEVGTFVCGYEVIGTDDEIERLVNRYKNVSKYFIGVGDMRARAKMILWINSNTKLEAVNIIHPSALISTYARLGVGNLFEAFTKIANNATIGNHCIVNSFTAVNHDQVIGDNVLIAGCVSLAGKSIGENTIIADGASVGFKVSVGKNCIIGDGAVVTKNLGDNIVAYGNPARIVKNNNW